LALALRVERAARRSFCSVSPLSRLATMLLWILRGCFVVLMLGVALITLENYSGSLQFTRGYMIAAGIVLLGGAILYADVKLRNKEITTISAVYFGLLLGLLLGTFLSAALDPFLGEWFKDVPQWGKTIKLLITIVCCYVVISTLLQTKDEFRFIIPYVEFSKQIKGQKPLVVDTSVIIDGRIADICDTRIVDSKLIIPRFVLQELHAIADSSDKLKRNRGRRGLDILKRLQSNSKIDLQMHEANLPEVREVNRVDERLVAFAKVLGARVMTNDFNLNKIAQLHGVEVINLNEVSNALKTVALPGEALTVKIVKPGDQIGQGVGYLDDGTMVVVEQGRAHIGQDVIIAVTSVLQTPAGRMIFGRVDPRAGMGGSSAEMPKLGAQSTSAT
jgi:uncharacterized protein YacL